MIEDREMKGDKQQSGQTKKASLWQGISQLGIKHQSELSGARLASTWEIVGGLSIFICPIGYYLTSNLTLWLFLGIGFGVIPLSVAAIIRAINANTLEIRKLNQCDKD